MPYVNVQIANGATREQKAQLVKGLADSLANSLGKLAEQTHVVIREIIDENWRFSWLLTVEWNKAELGSGSGLHRERIGWRHHFIAKS